MAWRTVILTGPARASLKKSQLCLERGEGTVTVPMEDIAVLVAEHRDITVTSSALSALMENGAVVAVCDTRHTPNGLMVPFHTHSRQSQIAHLQVAWSSPFKKRVWQHIIRAKIANQAHLLARVHPKTAKKLTALAKQISSGDPENREAQAARLYWPALMGPGFIRGHSDFANAALNYGYAVVRAAIARAVVGAGLLPAFGIHHNSDLNGFNLVDDLIEPYRPFVDACVMGLKKEEPQDGALGKDHKAALAGLLSHQVLIAGELQTILNAATMTAESLVRSLRDKKPSDTDLPEFDL